jgi:heme/copper-type cytochrome/quinol oxidase subunit 3
MIGTRCSAFVSILISSSIVFVWRCPQRGFGLSDDQFVLILASIESISLWLAGFNAFFAVCIIIRFNELSRSAWLCIALLMPFIVAFGMPALASA